MRITQFIVFLSHVKSLSNHNKSTPPIVCFRYLQGCHLAPYTDSDMSVTVRIVWDPTGTRPLPEVGVASQLSR